jgi:hypothetical protein
MIKTLKPYDKTDDDEFDDKHSYRIENSLLKKKHVVEKKLYVT